MSKLFAEFFAGMGLVRAGLEPSGWTCAYANDFDEKKKQLYEGHFGPSPEYHCEDIWNVEEVLTRLPENLSLATASFPCIDVSIAGHWRGMDGKHSSTFFAFVEILAGLKASKPPVLLIENVVGLLKSRDGKDFARVCQSISKLGYWLDAFILDAKSFVPQSRPRIFLVGVSQALCNAPIFESRRTDLFGTSLFSGDIALRPPHLESLRQKTLLETGWLRAKLPIPSPRKTTLADVLDSDDSQNWWDRHEVERHLDLMQVPSRARLDSLLESPDYLVGGAFRRTRLGKPRTEVRFDLAGCLRTPKGGSARQIVVRVGRGHIDLRWMTAREYARLQGIPEFRMSVPERQALYGFGDAVCVPAIAWIDEHLLSPLFAATLVKKAISNGRHSVAS